MLKIVEIIIKVLTWLANMDLILDTSQT